MMLRDRQVIVAALLAPALFASAAWAVSFPGSSGFLTCALLAAEPQGPGLIRSATSGPWSAPETWEGGKVPQGGAKVQIRQGHTVLYDATSDQPIRLIHIAGTLSFATDRDTRLDVGLIKIQSGDDASEEGFECEAHLPDRSPGVPRAALVVGTPDHPVEARHSALIRLVRCENVNNDSWPAIVCCGGRMDFHGAPLNRTWVKLDEAANSGDAAVTLSEPVTGWRPGDRIIVTGTQLKRAGAYRAASAQTEERLIREIAGNRLTLDRPLEHDHLCEHAFRAEVANLSRNVVVESAEPQQARGHTMYHRDSMGSISYAEFRRLGKPDTLGRYSLHFHLVGDTMRGSSVIGASIWDSGNRWLTIHGTNDLVVRDCVGYRSTGHGFYLEDGTEVRNVLDRNLAVQAFSGKRLKGQVLPFDKNDGAGFWWANSLNTFTRNVACENERYGYRFEATPSSAFDLDLNIQQPDRTRRNVDIRTLPFVRFEDNESHSDGFYGFNLGEGVDRTGPDARHPFVVRNMKIWQTHYAFRGQCPNILLENMHIHKCYYGIYHADFDRHVYRNLTLSETSDEPFSSSYGDTSIQHGRLAVDGLTFKDVRKGNRMLIPLTHINSTGLASSHFRNVQRVGGDDGRPTTDMYGGKWALPPTPHGVPVYFHDYFGPGRHAKVVSVRAHDLYGDGTGYRQVDRLTGEETRAAEVTDVEFPTLLDPVDDLPPATVITYVTSPSPGSIRVRGTTSDNGPVRRVLVNGREARATSDNFAEWEADLEATPGPFTTLAAHAEDAAGNVELVPHSWTTSH